MQVGVQVVGEEGGVLLTRPHSRGHYLAITDVFGVVRGLGSWRDSMVFHRDLLWVLQWLMAWRVAPCVSVVVLLG